MKLLRGGTPRRVEYHFSPSPLNDPPVETPPPCIMDNPKPKNDDPDAYIVQHCPKMVRYENIHNYTCKYHLLRPH